MTTTEIEALDHLQKPLHEIISNHAAVAPEGVDVMTLTIVADLVSWDHDEYVVVDDEGRIWVIPAVSVEKRGSSTQVPAVAKPDGSRIRVREAPVSTSIHTWGPGRVDGFRGSNEMTLHFNDDRSVSYAVLELPDRPECSLEGHPDMWAGGMHKCTPSCTFVWDRQEPDWVD